MNEAQIRARVMQLWQTRLLLFTRLSVGQWIGGDRDGNPNVTAQTPEYALRRQCEVALRQYLTELFWLGSELSLSALLVQVSPAMQALAQSSPDVNEHRQDEPYRRAVTGMYSRLAATLKDLTGGEAARHAVPPRNPYRGAEEFLEDLRTIRDSLLAHNGGPLVQQRLHALIRAVEVFGFHLATVDLRQNSEQHEEVVAELLATARLERNYRKLDEAGKPAVLLSVLNDARRLKVLGVDYTEHARKELAIFESAHRMRTQYGVEAIRHYIISHTEAVSDLIEVLVLQQEVGLLQGTPDDHAKADLIVVPLFETIGDLRLASSIMRLRCPRLRSDWSSVGRPAVGRPAAGSPTRQGQEGAHPATMAGDRQRFSSAAQPDARCGPTMRLRQPALPADDA